MPELGYRYQMNDVTAAIGLAMLPHVKAHNARRREIAERYVAEITSGTPPDYDPDRRSSFHFLPMFFPDPDEVRGRLREAEIFPGMHYRRNDLYVPFRDCPRDGEMKGAEFYERHELTLPLHPRLTDEEVGRVIEVVNG